MSDTHNKPSRILSMVGFSILAALFGVGVAWIFVCILVFIFRHHSEQIFTHYMPIFIAGGTLGLVVGIVVSVRVAKSDPQTRHYIVERYVGGRGRMAIYF